MCNINEGKLGVDKFAHTHTHTHTHERRELLSFNECNFNSRNRNGGGRYLNLLLPIKNFLNEFRKEVVF